MELNYNSRFSFPRLIIIVLFFRDSNGLYFLISWEGRPLSKLNHTYPLYLALCTTIALYFIVLWTAINRHLGMHRFHLSGVRAGILPVLAHASGLADQGVRTVLQAARWKSALSVSSSRPASLGQIFIIYPSFYLFSPLQIVILVEQRAIRYTRHVLQAGHTVQRLQRVLRRISEVQGGMCLTIITRNIIYSKTIGSVTCN